MYEWMQFVDTKINDKECIFLFVILLLSHILTIFSMIANIFAQKRILKLLDKSLILKQYSMAAIKLHLYHFDI